MTVLRPASGALALTFAACTASHEPDTARRDAGAGDAHLVEPPDARTERPDADASSYLDGAAAADATVLDSGDTVEGGIADADAALDAGLDADVSCSGDDECAIVRAAAAPDHTCAIEQTGTVICWGLNLHGQLGRTDIDRSSVPVVVDGAPAAVDITCGDGAACALTAEGSAYCWGREVLLGRDDFDAPHHVPTAVADLTDAEAIDAGYETVCVVRATGEVACWGDMMGQPGSYFTPSTLPGISGAVQVAIGRAHACVLFAEGGVSCWGSNEYGQLGVGMDIESSAELLPVSGISDAIHIDAHFNSTCAVSSDGSTWCWGTGISIAMAGEPTGTPRHQSEVEPLEAVSVGGAPFACGVSPSGAMGCWGSNAYGELGRGYIGSFEREPYMRVPDLADIARTTSATSHSCARSTDNRLWCWGANINGQVGDGTTTTQPEPTRVYRE